MDSNFLIPEPMIDKKELDSIDVLTKKYEKMCEPGWISKTGKKVSKIIPEKVKKVTKEARKSISEKEIYMQMMKLVGEGFKVVEEQASKYSLNEKEIIKRLNKKTNSNIKSIDEICLLRSYDIAATTNTYKIQDIVAALAEGAGTGVAGFVGLPFNLVLSTFLYFRAVQSIAMFYGFDVKNDNAELVIASDVFKNALNPSNDMIENEAGTYIGKIMVITQTEVVKQTAKKSWTDMASKNGVTLLITQMRALANKSAQKALEKAGQKGLEKNMFSEVLEQIGKKLSLSSTGKLAMGVGAIFGALIDTAQMNSVLEYADTFYRKRFILEKESNILKLKEKNEK